MNDKNKTQRTSVGFGPARGFGHGRMPAEKVKDFKGTLKRLLKYFEPQKWALIGIFLITILGTVFNIVGPKILGMATNKLVEGFVAKFRALQTQTAVVDGIDFAYIGRILLILLILYIISSAFTYLSYYIMASVSQKIVFTMRKDINEKLSRLPLKYFDSKTHGEILSRVTNDVDNIATTLQQGLSQIITSVVTLIGIIVMMITINPILTLITILTLPLYAVVMMFITKKSQRYFAAQQKTLGNLNGHVEEMYTGHVIVKSYNYEKKSIIKFRDVNEKLYHYSWKAQFMSGIIMPLMNFIGNLSYVLICIVGGIFALRQTLNVGDIQAFIQYSRQFTQPISQAANMANLIQSTVASAERVFEIMDETEEIQDSKDAKIIISPQGVIKFDDVFFSYKKGISLIENMNIDVNKGQTIAIVGPTGAGKTTLVNLLMRFYEIDSGKITFDDIDIRELKRNNLRSMFGMVLQDTWLFNGTIKDNIAYGRLNSTEEEIIAAATAAHADHFIRTLPDGYETILNEEASNISQGQKQLITIARALLANPAVLILDEATSSVDTRTESYIQNAMTRLMQGRTNFVIAHRLSTIRGADMILVMNHGRIIEQGKHEELLKKNGFYAELYNSQFTGASISNS